jgi:hypothetical protein
MRNDRKCRNTYIINKETPMNIELAEKVRDYAKDSD